jgi:hypothetical protein
MLSEAGYETVADGTSLRVNGPFVVCLETQGLHPPGAAILLAYSRAIEKVLEGSDKEKAPVGIYSGLFSGLREQLCVVPLWFLLLLLESSTSPDR